MSRGQCTDAQWAKLAFPVMGAEAWGLGLGLYSASMAQGAGKGGDPPCEGVAVPLDPPLPEAPDLPQYSCFCETTNPHFAKAISSGSLTQKAFWPHRAEGVSQSSPPLPGPAVLLSTQAHTDSMICSQGSRSSGFDLR